MSSLGCSRLYMLFFEMLHVNKNQYYNISLQKYTIAAVQQNTELKREMLLDALRALVKELVFGS